MEIKLIIIDDRDAEQLLKRLAKKETVNWPTGLLSERESVLKVDTENKTITIFKSKEINQPLKL